MNFKTFILIIARFRYFNNNNVTGMLYFADQLSIAIYVEEMTPHRVGWSRHQQMELNVVLLGHQPQARQARGN
jgi:hypothetical protein